MCILNIKKNLQKLLYPIITSIGLPKGPAIVSRNSLSIELLHLSIIVKNIRFSSNAY